MSSTAAQRHAPRQAGEEGIARLGGAAAQQADVALAVVDLEHAAHQPDGALVAVTDAEQRAPGRQRAHGDLLGERGKVLALHAIQRREAAEQLD